MKRHVKNNPMPIAATVGLCFSLLTLVLGLVMLNPVVMALAVLGCSITGAVVVSWVKS